MATIIDELVATLGYDLQDAGDSKKFEASLDRIEKRAYAVGEGLRKFATYASVAAAGAMSFLGKGVIDTAANFETYGATLETIEGSAEKAKASLDWLSKFAATTPYEIDELTNSFVKLKAYGIEPMDGTMTVLGDTAAAMGKSLNMAVEAFADAGTMSFERLKEFGITSKTEGEKVTFSWQQNGKAMSKTVAKTGKDIQKFLKDTWGSKFGGAMLRQSKTWKGMMSNLGDSWTDFMRRIGDAGFFDTVKNKLASLLDTIAEWNTNGTIDDIAKGFSRAFTAIADTLGIVADRIATHLKFIRANFEEIKPYLVAAGIGFGLLIAATRPLWLALTLAAIAIDDLLTHLEGGESVIGRFKQWLKDLVPGTEGLKEAFANISLAVTAGLSAAFVLAPMTMAGIVARLVGSVVLAIAPPLIAALTGLSGAIAAGVGGAFAFLATPVGWAVLLTGIGVALTAAFWPQIKAAWDSLDFAALGKSLMQGIINGVMSMAGALASAVAAATPEAGRIMNGAGMGMQPLSGKPLFGGDAGKKLGNEIKNNNNTNNTTVNTTVNVKQATDAPAAVGNAVSGAAKAAAPSRMQTGPDQ